MSRSSSAKLSDARLADRSAGFVNHLHRFGHTLHSSLPSEMSTERLAGVFNVQGSMFIGKTECSGFPNALLESAEGGVSSIDHVTESPQECRRTQSLELAWAAFDKFANKRFVSFPDLIISPV
jgi:hypothetical protein